MGRHRVHQPRRPRREASPGELGCLVPLRCPACRAKCSLLGITAHIIVTTALSGSQEQQPAGSQPQSAEAALALLTHPHTSPPQPFPNTLLHLVSLPPTHAQAVLVEKSPTGYGIDYTFDCTGNVQACLFICALEIF